MTPQIWMILNQKTNKNPHPLQLSVNNCSREYTKVLFNAPPSVVVGAATFREGGREKVSETLL